MLENYSTFAPESCEFEHGGAHPDKAIKRGRSFTLVVSFYCFFSAIIWAVRLPACFFLVTKYF